MKKWLKIYIFGLLVLALCVNEKILALYIFIGILFGCGFVAYKLILLFVDIISISKKKKDGKPQNGWQEVILDDGSKYYVPAGVDINTIKLPKAAPKPNYEEDKSLFKLRGILFKGDILTKTEYRFWILLRRACGKDYIICPKVRLEDFLTLKKDLSPTRVAKYRGYIKSRHIDFLLCDNALNILAGIELDDRSHLSKKAEYGDTLKNEIFSAIQVPLFRVPVNEQYYEKEISKILEFADKKISVRDKYPLEKARE